MAFELVREIFPIDCLVGAEPADRKLHEGKIGIVESGIGHIVNTIALDQGLQRLCRAAQATNPKELPGHDTLRDHATYGTLKRYFKALLIEVPVVPRLNNVDKIMVETFSFGSDSWKFYWRLYSVGVDGKFYPINRVNWCCGDTRYNSVRHLKGLPGVDHYANQTVDVAHDPFDATNHTSHFANDPVDAVLSMMLRAAYEPADTNYRQEFQFHFEFQEVTNEDYPKNQEDLDNHTKVIEYPSLTSRGLRFARRISKVLSGAQFEPENIGYHLERRMWEC